mmetsp:Transcript_67420/g.112943  ORF Transcript_67420/g.112943 Transcript_67420/m.112943 type:complete len:120 (-) Transcript_67420:715-1074(-)
MCVVQFLLRYLLLFLHFVHLTLECVNSQFTLLTQILCRNQLGLQIGNLLLQNCNLLASLGLVVALWRRHMLVLVIMLLMVMVVVVVVVAMVVILVVVVIMLVMARMMVLVMVEIVVLMH